MIDKPHTSATRCLDLLGRSGVFMMCAWGAGTLDWFVDAISCRALLCSHIFSAGDHAEQGWLTRGRRLGAVILAVRLQWWPGVMIKWLFSVKMICRVAVMMLSCCVCYCTIPDCCKIHNKKSLLRKAGDQHACGSARVTCVCGTHSRSSSPSSAPSPPPRSSSPSSNC